MTLIKTTIFTAISTLIRIISAFLINKVMAVYVGPAGLAIVGQLQNFTSILTTFSNGAITQGIVKYTAEYQSMEEKQKIFSSSIVISFCCSLVISIVLFCFSSYFSVLILKSQSYQSVFIIFGLTIFLFAMNTVLMSILNGQKEIKKYVSVNIATSLFSLFFTSLLIVKLNLTGAMYAIVMNQSVIFFVTLAFVVKSKWFRWEYFKQGIDKDSLIKLSKYSLMAITSALTVPVSNILIRNYVGEHLTWDAAGYCQGIWYISNMYLMVITTSLNIYYLPRLAEIHERRELIKEIINGYKIIMPMVLLSAGLIFICRKEIIMIIFSLKFMPMMELFKWQLVGDVIKMCSWLLGYVMIAKAMTKVVIYTEVGFSVSLVLLSIWFIKYFGIIGVTYAFALNYMMHLLTMAYVFKKRFI